MQISILCCFKSIFVLFSSSRVSYCLPSGRNSGKLWAGRGGRTRGWDSGRAQWWGHHSWFWYCTLPLLLFIVINSCVHIYVLYSIHIFFCSSHSSVSPLFFLGQMSPPMGRWWGLELRKRRTWRCCIAGCKWGASHTTRGRGTGAPARSEFISFPSFGFLCGFLLLFTFLPLYFFIFQGLDLLDLSIVGGNPEITNGGAVFGGLWLGEDESGNGRFRDEGFLWASEGSNVTFLHVLSPTSS